MESGDRFDDSQKKPKEEGEAVMVYKILWKERYKKATFIATRDGIIVQVSTEKVDHFLGRDVGAIGDLIDRLEGSMSVVSAKTKI
jgi:hypothetical protein